MEKPLAGRKILIAEDEAVCLAVLEKFLRSLGADTFVASDGITALRQLKQIMPDLLICDLEMPEMNGLQLVEQLRTGGEQLPILIISATENMSDIAHVLRLGVQDVLLKPISSIERLREAVYECLYPSMFTSKVAEDEQLFEDWDALVQDPSAAAKLLQQLKPPVQQYIAHCRVNYRQLTTADDPGLVLDIAALSESDLAFYCLDVTRAGNNGVLAALLLRALFNGLVQEQLSGRRQRLPELNELLKKVNALLRRADLQGQFPLVVGYYHQKLKSLLLVSAGLNASLDINAHHIQLNSGTPLGTLNHIYLNQISQRGEEWQCQIWGAGGKLRLMLSNK